MYSANPTISEIENTSEKAFTLIEMSVVLVIVALIVGGVLVGRDLIGASGVQATIAQIDKYNAAVHTFDAQYGYLPGDIPAAAASQYGFAARGLYGGEGDGNGIITGIGANAPGLPGTGDSYWQGAGETVMFWVDLGKAGLIGTNFRTASSNSFSAPAPTPPAMTYLYLPPAKLGRENFIYVWSGGVAPGAGGQSAYNKTNYFGVAGVAGLRSQYGSFNTSTNMTVAEAYAMDKKIDDGFPVTGTITLQGVNEGYMWTGYVYPSATNTYPASTTSCADNGGIAAATIRYSMSTNKGDGINCAVSFEFQ